MEPTAVMSLPSLKIKSLVASAFSTKLVMAILQVGKTKYTQLEVQSFWNSESRSVWALVETYALDMRFAI